MQWTKNDRSCRVRWDSDGSVTRVPCAMVERIGEDSEHQVHQSSDSDESESGTTSQEISESSEDEGSGDEETDEGSSSSSDENTVQAHGIKCSFVKALWMTTTRTNDTSLSCVWDTLRPLI